VRRREKGRERGREGRREVLPSRRRVHSASDMRGKEARERRRERAGETAGGRKGGREGKRKASADKREGGVAREAGKEGMQVHQLRRASTGRSEGGWTRV